MSLSRPWLLALAVCTAVAWSARAHAERPTCEDLRSALEVGRSAAEVARDFHTTQARVVACVALAEQRDLHDEQRSRFEARRIERGLHMD